jgi:hypothetical protein
MKSIRPLASLVAFDYSPLEGVMLTGYKADFLRSNELIAQRKKRILNTDIRYVVWIELENTNMVELDATSKDHAEKIAHHWLYTMGNVRSASYRPVTKEGRITRNAEKILDTNHDWWDNS